MHGWRVVAARMVRRVDCRINPISRHGRSQRASAEILDSTGGAQPPRGAVAMGGSLDHGAAEATLAVVEDDVLARRRRALRLIEAHLELALAAAHDGAGLIG